MKVKVHLHHSHVTGGISGYEKNAIKKLIREFLVRQDYFGLICKKIPPELLETIASGKGIFPYEKIVS